MNPRDRKLLLNYFESIISYIPIDTMDEGIGTAYERSVISAFLTRLGKRYNVRTVLEFPCDGITGLLGINSLVFSRKNCDVVLCNPVERLLLLSKVVWTKLGLSDKADFVLTSEDVELPFPDESFDLVWNFCMFERYVDPTALIKEMSRLTRKLILVMTQNWKNWGTGPHRLYHRMKRRPWDHGYKRYMEMSTLEEFMKKVNLQIIDFGGIDIPPIIDTWDLPIRGTLETILKVAGKEWRWKMSGEKSEKSSKLLDLFTLLENNLPNWFKEYQAHHLYVVAMKKLS